jgi:hypothetical protein|tara:strand:+ start:779 stop:1138 length:360 start_codon:yes stop_codon:yes gene_type:complete
MKKQQSIVVDFDGVICEHRFPDVGEPSEGVQEALNTLRKAGYRIVIHSCRTSFRFKNLLSGDQFERIKDYMKHYKLPFDKIWEPEKPIGVAYIDDKGIKFNNNWGEITDKLLSRSKKNK